MMTAPSICSRVICSWKITNPTSVPTTTSRAERILVVVASTYWVDFTQATLATMLHRIPIPNRFQSKDKIGVLLICTDRALKSMPNSRTSAAPKKP